MHRLFRLSFLVALICVLGFMPGRAQSSPDFSLSGTLPAGSVKILHYDPVNSYTVSGEFSVEGTLIIEPRTTIVFLTNSRIVLRAGSRLIADGRTAATYTANPDGKIPRRGDAANTENWLGYGDLNYFLYSSSTASTVNVNTVRDLTINQAKYDDLFYVTLNTNTRKITSFSTGNAGDVRIPYEKAIVYDVAGVENIDYTDPTNDLNSVPLHKGNGTPDVLSGRITFRGNSITGPSYDWGHIVILPGVKTAFFRDCDFQNFRHDMYTGSQDVYTSMAGLTPAKLADLNLKMKKATLGSGGAVTTFASRTWMLNCVFSNNMARYNGGALQILQAPEGFPAVSAGTVIGTYDLDKNPALTDRFGNPSKINSNVKAIDFADETTAELSVNDHQAVDDARAAVLLGRFRNLTFENNKVLLSDTGFTIIDGRIIYGDDTTSDAPINVDQVWRNQAFGGALYISGRENSTAKEEMLIGLGVNTGIKMNGKVVDLGTDKFSAVNNKALNYQNDAITRGARGGAIYLGESTSLVIKGQLLNNTAATPRFTLANEYNGYIKGTLAMGGAIYQAQSLGELYVRGSVDNNIPSTRFANNNAGLGGAIYVGSNNDENPRVSPVIGGSDATANTRDYGIGISFDNNDAISGGGAVYTNRNMIVWGSGGVISNTNINYGGLYRPAFTYNNAGYAGGAVEINLPTLMTNKSELYRGSHFVRALFDNNMVGEGVDTLVEVTQIRGGGAVYCVNGDIPMIKAVDFTNNMVHNANGAAIALVNPGQDSKRFIATDLDAVTFDANGNAIAMNPRNDIFTWNSNDFAPNAKMLTRFINNKTVVDAKFIDTLMGSGTTQIGKGTEITNQNILGVSFYAANNVSDNGFAVGTGSTIIKLTRQPQNWKWDYLNWTSEKVDFRDVKFINNTTAIIVGTNGIILKAVGGGSSWNFTEVRQPNYTNHLNNVNFFSAGNGFAVGSNGQILKTNDGGDTWTVVNNNGITTNDLTSSFFIDNRVGYITGKYGTILKTTDAGANWTPMNLNTMMNFKGVYFRSYNEGYIACEGGTILKTTDGGSSWNPETVPSTASNFNAVNFPFGYQNGFAIGENGAIFTKNINGTAWSQVANTYTQNLNAMCFPVRNYGFIGGDNGCILETQDYGATWTKVIPFDLPSKDVRRYHPEPSVSKFAENGVGLGGAIYVLDQEDINKINRADSVVLNRVRFQNNQSFTGACVYSDNFNLNFVMNRSLATGNVALSQIGANQNVISGGVVRRTSDTLNPASSDLAGAIFYCDLNGPLPSWTYSATANKITGNTARFIVRLPDVTNAKGITRSTMPGISTTDSLGGNYWGKTEANVKISIDNGRGGNNLLNTYYVETDGTTTLQYLVNRVAGRAKSQILQQGPFESTNNYTYTPIPLQNFGANQFAYDTVNSIPEKLLMVGRVYDIFDKGADVKMGEYSSRRMTAIEDFSIGSPRGILKYTQMADANGTLLPSYNSYVKRYLRDPFMGAFDSLFALPVNEFLPDPNGLYANTNGLYHPIGYPLYLEAKADYNVNGNADVDANNNDNATTNRETVYFVINETTGDYIRVNMNQISTGSSIFRARVELVPDSTNRIPNTKIRRSSENLLNFGVGSDLLKALWRNPFNEDKSALGGRRYQENKNRLGDTAFFSNRNFPTANNNIATYFAGERYRALPVNVGDVVKVVSRTMLWKGDNYQDAEAGKLQFVIGSSINPPEFTGNVLTVHNNPVDKNFNDIIQVTEGRTYPALAGTYSSLKDGSKGRDSIMTVTGIDRNFFYDPRSYVESDSFSRLNYKIEFLTNNSGVSRWLMWDDKKASAPQFYGAQGYEVFRGRPLNPWVVPGGEKVRVTIENFPPHWRTLDSIVKSSNLSDSLKKVFTDRFIAAYCPTFPKYMHAMQYDGDLARYLQQDTLDIASKYTRSYDFTVLVVDSTPKFLDYNFNNSMPLIDSIAVNTYGLKKEYVTYKPTEYTAGVYPLANGSGDYKIVANVTDKLRLQLDYNTDDEMEDAAAYAWDTTNHRTPVWDFRYGRTAYGFTNRSINGADVVDMDNFSQVKPAWMQSQYMFNYNQELVSTNAADDFLKQGKLNFRIPRAEALSMLTPPSQINGTMITDTMFSVVVNDGHGKIAVKTVPVYINYAPEIVTNSLPDATEGVEYNEFDKNGQLLDSTKIIKVYDPNFEQTHSYYILYADKSLNGTLSNTNSVPKDKFYSEAGSWDISDKQTAPSWIKINQNSGMLYGTPGIQDAPKADTIWVLVYDNIVNNNTTQTVLSTLKQFIINVKAVNHMPSLSSIPAVKCVEQGAAYSEKINVSDLDLIRNVKGAEETLTIKVIPDGLTVTPAQITGPTDQVKEVTISSSKLNLQADIDGYVNVKVIVTDSKNAADTSTYKLFYSEPTSFVNVVTVTALTGESQNLEWGTAPKATIGNGDDGYVAGKLDSNYCEIEIPPTPVEGVFDARWTMTNRRGLYRDIYPTAISGSSTTRKTLEYFAQFQTYGSGLNYPITLVWDPSTVPAVNDTARNRAGSNWYIKDNGSASNRFIVNMKNGAAKTSPAASFTILPDGKYQVTIHTTEIDGFEIIYDIYSDVKTQDDSYATKINSIGPNPVNSQAVVYYTVAQSSNVKIEVFDNLGNVVKSFNNMPYAVTGENQFNMNVEDLQNGTYTVVLNSNGTVSSYQMAIVK